MVDVRYELGCPESARSAAADLYDEAFSQKLSPAIRNETSRRAILSTGLDLSRCIAAFEGGRLIGIAGFHDAGGSLTGGITFGSIRREIGLVRAIRAIAVFALLERNPEPGELLMDGVVVHSDCRGRGIGTGLFAALEDYSRSIGHNQIRLDVVDTNPGARRLYEKLGFVAGKVERTPFLRPIMGFGESTTMVKELR
ncbi:MAG: GNAT family N-acetyltransferase [bacterium]|nr:GNAT family N-acetyltransferase [bacterium]